MRSAILHIKGATLQGLQAEEDANKVLAFVFHGAGSGFARRVKGREAVELVASRLRRPPMALREAVNSADLSKVALSKESRLWNESH